MIPPPPVSHNNSKAHRRLIARALQWMMQKLQWAEGEFSPTLQDASFSDSESQAYTSQLGYYRRIGDICFFWIDMEMSSLGTLTSTDNAYFANLPYTVYRLGTVNVGRATNLTVTAGEVVTGLTQTGQNYIVLRLWDATGGTTNLKISEIGATSRFVLSGNYLIQD